MTDEPEHIRSLGAVRSWGRPVRPSIYHGQPGEDERRERGEIPPSRECAQVNRHASNAAGFLYSWLLVIFIDHTHTPC